MKLIHLSDLHLGKRLNDYSLIEDQEYILLKIINIIDEVKPDGVILAGDIYDKSVPPAEAVELFDSFLTKLSYRDVQVYVISGNHDSPERIAFGSRLMDKSGIHLSKVYDGNVEPYKLTDENGDAFIYLLPFIKPVHVRRYFDDEVASYTDAMRVAISHMNIDKNARNILVTHQFVTGATRSESEEMSVGGTDNVDVSVFDDFDYVALGHIHSPQNCSSNRVRYCGTPLKYSFSESKDQKSVTVVELGKKGELSVETIPLIPKRDMVELKGKYDELCLKSFYENTTYRDDYVHITLTDEEDVVDAIGKLRTIYCNLMKLDYDNTRTRSSFSVEGVSDVDNKSPYELFSELYELQNGKPMNDKQSQYITELIEKIWGNEQ